MSYSTVTINHALRIIHQPQSSENHQHRHIHVLKFPKEFNNYCSIVSCTTPLQLRSEKLLSMFCTHRILVQHMPEFKEQAKGVVWHIPNKYAQQMAEKSTVVSHFSSYLILPVYPPVFVLLMHRFHWVLYLKTRTNWTR